MKKYTSDIRNVEARPRSERLRKLGVPVSASGRNVINVSDGAAASGDDGWKELIGKDPETGFLNLLRTVTRLALGSRGKSVSDIVDSEDLKAEGVELTDDALITAKAAVGSIDELLKDALAKLNDIFIHKDREDSTEFLVRFLAGLEYGLYAEGGTDGGKLHPDGLAELGRLRSNGDAEFRGSLSSKEFISGFNTGKGWAIRLRKLLNAAGVEEEKAEMELDNLIVRGTMRVFEFIVSQMLGENDNRIFTGMMEVDHYDPKTGTVYLQTEDGKLYNPFRKDDIIIVQQYNGMPSEENGHYVTKQYELLVTEVGVGSLSDKEDRLDWLRFTNFTTTMEGVSPEELITKGDTFVRIDNLTDPDRKGIIQMMTVGSDTPYMDILYGVKTDPANKLKGRFGNLKGVYNPLFGWLREFGAYLINLYAVGEFRLRATGESLDTRIEMLRNQFVTNYRQWEYELTEEDNFLHNAVFSDSMEGWTVLHQPELITVNGNPMLLNRAVALTKTGIAAPEEHDGRIMLRIRDNGVRQANALIRQPGTHNRYVMDDDGVITEVEEPDTLYLSLCAQFVTSGTLEIGFEGASSAEGAQHDYIESIDASNDYVTMQWSGVWDGTGDFRLSYTGDCYIRLLSVTTDPLDNYRTETQTWLSQTGRVIGLYGQRISRTEKSVTDLKVEIDAADERITAEIGKVTETANGIRTDLSQLQLRVGEISATVSSHTASISGVKTDIAELKVTTDGLTSTVASVQGDLEQAKNTAAAAAKAAQDKADSAYRYADSAWGLAYTANTNAATAISQSGKAITILAANFDDNGNVLQSSGIVTGTTFNTLFSEAVTDAGLVKRAELSTYVTKDSDGYITTGIRLKADQIVFSGYTNINNGAFQVAADGTVTIGGFTVTSSALGATGNNKTYIKASGELSIGTVRAAGGSSSYCSFVTSVNGGTTISSPNKSAVALKIVGMIDGLRLQVQQMGGTSSSLESMMYMERGMKIIRVTAGRKSIMLPYPSEAEGTVLFVVCAGAYSYTLHVAKQSSPIGGTETITGKLRNDAGAVVDTITSSSGRPCMLVCDGYYWCFCYVGD